MARSRMRRRRGFDPVLMREAIKGPGVDTRSWGSMARVVDDDDLDAFEWDAELGWLSSAVFVGGTLDGDGDNVIRIPSQAQGDGVGYYYPPRATGLVATVLPTADANDLVIEVGQLHNTDETAPARAPTTINGDAIVEREAAEGQVAAAETHMAVFPDEDLDQEWRNVRITGDAMVLGAPGADQPFVRGTDLDEALDDFADAISDIVTAINTGLQAAGSAIDPASLLLFETAVETFKNASEQYLSTRITGD